MAIGASAAATTLAVTVAHCGGDQSTTETTMAAEPATGLKFERRFTVKPDVGCPVSIDFNLVGLGAR
jgi:hypothetical protein